MILGLVPQKRWKRASSLSASAIGLSEAELLGILTSLGRRCIS